MEAVHAYALSDVRDIYLEASKAVLYYNIWKVMRRKILKVWDCIKMFSEKQLFVGYKLSSAHGLCGVQEQRTRTYRKESIWHHRHRKNLQLYKIWSEVSNCCQSELQKGFEGPLTNTFQVRNGKKKQDYKVTRFSGNSKVECDMALVVCRKEPSMKNAPNPKLNC